jgi:hypothetical protein
MDLAAKIADRFGKADRFGTAGNWPAGSLESGRLR